MARKKAASAKTKLKRARSSAACPRWAAVRRPALPAIGEADELRALVRASGDVILILDKNGRYLKIEETNHGLLYHPAPKLIGRTLHDTMPPAIADQFLGYVRTALDTQQNVQAEYSLPLNGREAWFTLTVSPMSEDKVLWLARSVSEQRKLEAYEARQRRVLELIAAGASLSEVLNFLARSVEEQSEGMLCSVLLLDPTRTRLWHGAAPSLPERYVRGIDGLPIGDNVGSCGTAAFRGQQVITEDVVSDPRWDNYRELALEHDLRACWSTPIKSSSGQVLGTFAMYYRQPRAPTAADFRLIESATRLAGIAIERQQAEAAEGERTAALEALQQASLGLTASLELRPVLDAILAATFRLIEGAHDAHIFLYHAEGQGRLEFAAGRWASGSHDKIFEPRPDGLTYTVARGGEMIVVPDMRSHPLFVDTPPEWGGAIIGLPLKIGERVLGVMNVAYIQPRAFTAAEVRLLGLLADQAAVALENARLFEAQRAAREQAEALREVAGALNASLESQQLLESILQQLERVVKYDSASIMLVGPGDSLSIVAQHGFRSLSQHAVAAASQSLAHVQAVITDRRPVIIADTDSDRRWRGLPEPSENYIRCWLGVPLVVKDRVIGLLNLDKEQPGFYTEADAQLAAAFASHAAVALENARLFEEAQRTSQTLAGLYETALATSSVLETKALLMRLFEQVHQLLAPDTFVVALYHAEADDLEVALAIEEGRVAPESVPLKRVPISDGGLTGWVVRQRRMLLVKDMESEPLPVQPRHGIRPARSWLGVPLIAGDRVVGAVSVQSFRPSAFNEGDARFLEPAAGQVAIALENARLYEALAAEKQRMELIYNLGQDLSARLDPEQVYAAIHRAVGRLMAADAFTIALLDELNNEIEIVYLMEGDKREPRYRLPASRGLTAHVIISERPLYIEDLETGVGVEVVRVGDPAQRVRSVLAVPMRLGSKVVGMLSAQSYRPRAYSADDQRTLGALAQQAAIAIENARLFETTRRYANEVTAASDILRSINALSDVSELCRIVAEGLRALTACDRVSVALLDERRETAVVAGLAPMRPEVSLGAQFPVSATAAAADVLAGRPHLTPELADEINYPVEKQLYSAGFHSRINLPLNVNENAIGALNMMWKMPRGYEEANLPLLGQIADAVALAVEKSRLLDETRRRDAILEALAYAGEQLLLPDSLPSALPDILERLGRAAGVSRAYLFENYVGADGVRRCAGRFEWAAPGQTPRSDDSKWQDVYREFGFGRWVESLSAGRPLFGPVRDFPAGERAAFERQHVRALLIAPIFSRGEWWGYLGFDECQRDRIWSAAEIEALKSAAGALGAAFDRRQSEEAERQQRALAEALRDTAAVLSSTLNFEEVLDLILANVGRVVAHDAADIMLIDSARTAARVVRNRGYAERDTEAWLLSTTFPLTDFANLRQMMEVGRPMAIADTHQYPEWVFLPESEWVRSFASAPIHLKGQVIGFLNLTSVTPGFFSQQHAERLQIFADQAAIAIENSQLYDAVQKNVAELSMLYRASTQLISPGGDLSSLGQQIVRLVAGEFSFLHCGVLMVDESRTKLYVLAHFDEKINISLRHLPLDGPGLTVAAVHSGEAIYAPEVTSDSRCVAVSPVTRSEFVVPLRVGDRVIGVLDLQSTEPEAFDERARRILVAFAEHAALALENAQLLERLDMARKTAEEVSRLKSEFLANTSHELRTPLTGIIGSLSMVLDDLCASPDEEREFVRIAYVASERLLTIINDVLDIAKIEAGRMDVEMQRVELGPLFDEVFKLTRVQADDKKLKLEVLTPPPAAAGVWADPDKLRQILINLVGNAIKFTERGSVRVSASADEGRVHIAICDTGIGIPPEKQSVLFQPFVQADGTLTRKYGGTGLGLSISRRLAEMMGGYLQLRSEGAGRGSTFTVTLWRGAPADS